MGRIRRTALPPNGGSLRLSTRYCDKAACILPTNDKDGDGPITDKCGFPKFQAGIKKKYTTIPNRYAFMQVKGDNGHTIKGS